MYKTLYFLDIHFHLLDAKYLETFQTEAGWSIIDLHKFVTEVLNICVLLQASRFPEIGPLAIAETNTF